MEKLLTVSDLAAYLNVPKSWVYQRTRQRGHDAIPVIRCKKYCRFVISDVLEWLEKQQEDRQLQGMKEDAQKLARILIELRKKYPLFLKDVDPNDPDLDMDRGFKTYEELKRQTYGR